MTTELERFQKAVPDVSWPIHWLRLHELLQPITWNWSSSIRGRQDLVCEYRGRVNLIKPFVGGKMRDLIDEWLEEERHGGLWD